MRELINQVRVRLERLERNKNYRPPQSLEEELAWQAEVQDRFNRERMVSFHPERDLVRELVKVRKNGPEDKEIDKYLLVDKRRLIRLLKTPEGLPILAKIEAYVSQVQK